MGAGVSLQIPNKKHKDKPESEEFLLNQPEDTDLNFETFYPLDQPEDTDLKFKPLYPLNQPEEVFEV